MPNKILGWGASAGVLIACLLSSPGPALAWKVDSHVYAANLVLEEALSTLTFQEAVVTDAALKEQDQGGAPARLRQQLRRPEPDRLPGQRLHPVDLLSARRTGWSGSGPVMAVQVPPFGWLRVSEDMARALFYFPGLMRAGAVGPDLFPDLITGQTVVHPGEGPRSGRWAAYLDTEVRRIAGLYDGSPGSFDESPVLRAYYAGWLAHMAGDLFGHSWVNDYAGGVWPNISDGIANEEKNNILRHLIVEAYVSKKIPQAFLAGQRVTLDLPAGASLTGRYVMKWLTGNGGRIDHDDSEDDRFGINPIITGYAAGTPYHLDLLFSIRSRLRDATENINWDALWAGFIMQMMFGYFDFGQASYLYNHQWFHDVDTALDELVDSQLNVARRMSAGEGFGAWFDELERWMLRYGLSALGLPDAVGRGIEMSGNAQEQIADAILPDEVEQAMSDLKRWFVDKVMEEAFGVTLTELERYLQDPGTYLTSRTLFPEGTKAKIDAELGNFAQAFSALECTRINFVPFQNTLNMIKLQLVDPEELVRVLWTERAFPQNLSTEEHIRAFVQTFFKSGIQMQFMAQSRRRVRLGPPGFRRLHALGRSDGPAEGLPPHLQGRPAGSRGRPDDGGGRTELRGLLAGVAIPAEVRLADGRERRRHRGGRNGPGAAATPGASRRRGQDGGEPRAAARNDLPGLRHGREIAALRPEARGPGRCPRSPGGVGVRRGASASPRRPAVRRRREQVCRRRDDEGRDFDRQARRGRGPRAARPRGQRSGAGLAYDAAKGVATLETPDGRYELRAGSAEVLANGRKKALARGAKTAPVAAGTTLLVPPGFFEEHLGARVVSLEKDKTVVIARRKFADDAPSTVTGGPAAADAAAPAAAGGASSSPWSGKWETTIGAMDIVVAADGSVDFKYDGEFGRLEGRISGNAAHRPLHRGQRQPREIVLTLGRENRTFTGQWRRTDLDEDYWHGCEGWRPFEEEAGAVPASAAADEAASSSWAGSWDTSIGDMVLRAEAGAVKGGYDGTFGRIEAKVSGLKLTGRFYEDNGNWGEFEFVLDPDGQAFKGRWRRLNVENDDWHACEGRRPEKTA